jgi:outer membrane protein TolC
MMLSRFSSLTVPLLACVCAVSACTLGPNYPGAPAVAPEAAQAAAFVRAPAAGVAPAHAPSPWWLALNDAQLNTLIAAALAHNPDVHIAQARLREARAQLQQQQADALPKASFDAAALRMREPNLSSLQGSASSSSSGTSSGTSSTGGGPLQLYTAGFDASWEIDLFGGTRRAVEAASAEAQAVNADLADAQVSLAAEVAQAYVDLRDEQQRLRLAQRSAELEQQMLALTQQRRARGTAADVDVERLTTQVENTRCTRPGAGGAASYSRVARYRCSWRPSRAAAAAARYTRGRTAAGVEQCADRRTHRGFFSQGDAAGRPRL